MRGQLLACAPPRGRESPIARSWEDVGRDVQTRPASEPELHPAHLHAATHVRHVGHPLTAFDERLVELVQRTHTLVARAVAPTLYIDTAHAVDAVGCVRHMPNRRVRGAPRVVSLLPPAVDRYVTREHKQRTRTQAHRPRRSRRTAVQYRRRPRCDAVTRPCHGQQQRSTSAGCGCHAWWFGGTWLARR